MSAASEMALPSGEIRKYSHSTPVLSSRLSAAAAAITFFKTWRGFCVTSLPSITRSPGTHATSGFQGSWMTLLPSGMARMSLSAGVMSSQVAKPAKPAPALATVSMAVAGTILARTVPNRSTKEIRKYLIP